MAGEKREPAFWGRDAAQLLAQFETSERGLSQAEAPLRLKQYGPNSVEDQVRLSALRLLLRQYESPLVLILVFGAMVSLAFQGWVDAGIILVIVFGSTLLGFVQEYRASTALAALRGRLALKALTLRDGQPIATPAASLVPGDIVQLSAGNLIPADGVVLEARDFLVSEASLTGESFPAEKRPGISAADAPLAQRSNAVFLGSSVRSGTATVLIAATGRATAFGHIAASLRAAPPETEFARGIRQFGYLLIRVMVLLLILVLVANQLLGRPTIESLMFAVALAVGLSPELLPAIMSVTLANGARAMAKRDVIVRRLEAIEDLGGMDVLCTDKTGTLTEGIISLSGAVDARGAESATVRRFAFLNASFESGIANPLDEAIVKAGERDSLTTEPYTKIDEIPYDFLRRRLTIVCADRQDPGNHWIIAKGAFDNILSVCGQILFEGKSMPLDAAERDRLTAFYRQKGEQGLRVLGLAIRSVAAKPEYAMADESAMSFAGFLLFSDPPKPEVAETIRELSELGIGIKIISGDNRYVTAHVAAAIGLDSRRMLTGAEISAARPDSLWHLVDDADLFAEIDPQQKESIVRALQHTGHTVGYLGDGINDAPALHTADVGISIDGAVDAARESADIILLRRDLGVLARGIQEGRRAFANTLKYIAITTSANFGNMISMAVMTPLMPFLPLAAKQILLNNFLSDLPSIAISGDRVEPAQVSRPVHWSIRDVRAFMIVFGLISTMFDLLTFGVLLFVFRADEPTFQTSWFVVSLLTELAVVLVLRVRGPAYRSMPGPVLLFATLAVGAVAVAIPYLGRAAGIFDFTPMPPLVMAASLAIVAGYIVTTEAAKRWFWRRRAGARPVQS